MGKQKLVEHIIVESKEIKKVPLTESTKKVMYEDKEYSCIAAYTMPVSRPDQENLNGRIYTKGLWEAVIKDQKEVWEGSFGLTDHPEEDGSVKDSFCVWHNLRFNEDNSLVIADAFLFGKWGQHAQEAVDAGGKIGISSVGYGDFAEDGKTIEESSYEIERPGDWVLNPSYQVFGQKSDQFEKEQKESGAAFGPAPSLIPFPGDLDKGTIVPDTEYAFRWADDDKDQVELLRKGRGVVQVFDNLDAAMRDIVGRTDVRDDIAFMDKWMQFYDDLIRRENVTESVAFMESITVETTRPDGTIERVWVDNEKAEQTEQLHDEGVTNNKEIDSKENEMKDKQESSTLDKKMSTILEKNFRFHVNGKIEKADELETAQEKLAAFQDILEDFSDFDDDSFAADLRKTVDEKIAELETEIQELATKGLELDAVKETQEGLEKEKTDLETENTDLKTQLEQLQAKYEAATKMLDELKEYTNKAKELYSLAKAESNAKVSATEYKELSVYAEDLEEQIENLKSKLKDKRQNRRTDVSENVKQKAREHFEMRKKAKAEAGEDDDVEDTDESEEAEESILSIRNDTEIQAYYDDLYDSDPRVEGIKEEILKAKTILEAQRTYLRLKSLIEDSPSVYKGRKTEKEDDPKSTPRGVNLKRLKKDGWI